MNFFVSAYVFYLQSSIIRLTLKLAIFHRFFVLSCLLLVLIVNRIFSGLSTKVKDTRINKHEEDVLKWQGMTNENLINMQNTPRSSTFEHRSRGQARSGGISSFATSMIIGPICFFLGILFSALPYDYPLLWTSDSAPEAYYDQLETHQKFLYASPPLFSRILHITIGIGFSGLFIKLFKPTDANLLFDGASLVLYVVGVIVYISNIVKGLRIVTDGTYGKLDIGESNPEMIIGREDSLKILAASNAILALVLVGILVLQAGQWYAERKEHDDVASLEEKEMKINASRSPRTPSFSHSSRNGSKKKQ